MKTKRITISKNNTSVKKSIETSINKKKTINEFIKEGKDLKQLEVRGIELIQPI